MLTTGFGTAVFVVKRMRTALAASTKGVVYPFLTPMVLSCALSVWQ